MKTAMQKMVEWLDNRDAHSGKMRKAELRYIRTKAHELLAEERCDKPRPLEASQAEKDKGLVEELSEVLHTPCLFTDSWRVVERAKEILSRHEKDI